MKSDAAHARSVCQSYEMDLMTLDSKQEYDDFMNAIVIKASSLVDQWYTMGAFTTVKGTKDNWRWSRTGNKINFDINWAPNEPDGAKNNLCLTMLNTPRFIFFDSPCYGYLNYGFFCEKTIETFDVRLS